MYADFSKLREKDTIRMSFGKKGYMLITPSTGCLELVYVREPFRRAGIGTAMLRHAKNLFPELWGTAASDEGKSAMRKAGVYCVNVDDIREKGRRAFPHWRTLPST
jgi:GNAT superfamily N-acetyltransferase